MVSKSLQGEGPAIPHLSKGEVADLRDDIGEGLARLEKKEGMAKVDRLDANLISLAGLPVDLVVTGRDLLAGQTFSDTTFGMGTAQLDFVARRPGKEPNLSVVLLSGAGEAVALNAAAGPGGEDQIEITLNDGVSTANSIQTLVQGDIAVNRLVDVVSGGIGNPVAAAEQVLGGGKGAGMKLWVNGEEQELEAQPTDSAVTVTVAALTGAVAADMVAVLVESDGVLSNSMSIEVAV